MCAGIYTPTHGHASVNNPEARHHTYGNDNHIMTKYVAIGVAMPSARLYSNLDLIGIFPLGIMYPCASSSPIKGDVRPRIGQLHPL
jgi:hypothetical protein